VNAAPHAGWPAAVPPPGRSGWDSAALTWLIDLLPPGHRGREQFRAHPAVLALTVRVFVAACVGAVRQAKSSAPEELGGHVPPEVIQAALRAYRQEETRLLDLERAVELVEEAILESLEDDEPTGTNPCRPPGGTGSAGRA
jgi:hypothetical protein